MTTCHIYTHSVPGLGFVRSVTATSAKAGVPRFLVTNTDIVPNWSRSSVPTTRLHKDNYCEFWLCCPSHSRPITEEAPYIVFVTRGCNTRTVSRSLATINLFSSAHPSSFYLNSSVSHLIRHRGSPINLIVTLAKSNLGREHSHSFHRVTSSQQHSLIPFPATNFIVF